MVENIKSWHLYSTSRREVEQVSQRFGSPSESSGSPFDRARKVVIKSINEIASYIEMCGLRMKQFISHAPTEDHGVAKASEKPSDDVGY